MTPVTLEFEIGRCNGSMTMEIISKNNRWVFADIVNDRLTVDISIHWPDVLQVNLTGKDLTKDTQVDRDGNIVANKYVRLTGVKVLNMDLIEPAIYRICEFYPQDGESKSDIFWDRDGYVKLSFDQKNPMRWNLGINNILRFGNGQ